MRQLVARQNGKRGLIALNAVLLAGVAFLAWGPLAGAQPGQPGEVAARGRGEYTMVAGKTMSGGAAAVYVVDSANQEIVALRWDQGKQQMIGLGYTNLQRDGRAIPGR